jgi:hypothetical protein
MRFERLLAVLLLVATLGLGAGINALGLQAQDNTALPSGSVLAADDFADASRGILPTVSQRPQQTQFGYVAGEYQLAIVDPSYTGGAEVQVPGVYGDTTTDLSVRMTGTPPTNAAFVIRCRTTTVTPSAFTAYAFALYPAEGRFSISKDVPRPDNSSIFTPDLVNPAGSGPQGFRYSSDAIQQGTASNHVQLRCSGNNITASINDAVVASVQDSSYTSGHVDLAAIYGTGGENNISGGADFRLANLVITQP